MENIIATGVIIGIINAVKLQFPKVAGLYAIALSVVLGVVAGFFNILGVANIETGLLVGLFASGVYVTAKRAGGK